MSSRKLFVVLGATGSQSEGGAVARFLLDNAKSEYYVRALTRNPTSSAAIELKDAGAEVVQADMSDRPSLEAAFKGAHTIFSVTDFFASLNVDVEIKQGVNIIEAAIAAASDTLECFLWSSLPDPRTMPVPFHNILHFNSKAEISQYLKHTKLWPISTIIWVAAYFENYTKFPQVYGPQHQIDGSFKAILPVKESTLLYETSVDDLGPLTYKISTNPTPFRQKTVTLVTDTFTPLDQVKVWAEILLIKKPVSFEEVSLEEFTARLEGFGYPDSLALELAENMACYKDNPEMWVPPGNIKATEILDDPIDWRTFVDRHDWSDLFAGGE